MRVNVYGEELTNNTEIVVRKVDGREFFGIRLYLKSHQDLHHSKEDNDESAITLWVPWENGKNRFSILLNIILRMYDDLNVAATKYYE